MSNSLFPPPTTSYMKAISSNRQQASNAPSGSSSMFNHGRKQRFQGNEISSAAGNIIIIKMNEPLKGKEVTPGPLKSSFSQGSSVTGVSDEGYNEGDDGTDESDEDLSIFNSRTDNSRPLRCTREPQVAVPSKLAPGKRTRSKAQRFRKKKKLRLNTTHALEQAEEITRENSMPPSPVTSEAVGWERSRENRVDIISTRDPMRSSPPEFERHNSSCQTYTKHMLMYRHGFPLWSPQLDCSLHVDYRTNGVNVGDVGIITLDGGFDFLFNIWLPAAHPIQPPDLLHDFDALERPKRNVSRQNEMIGAYNSMCYGAFNSTVNRDTGGLEFVCHEDEGSILALPDGASREDLKNERNLEEFIRKSAESWYRYAIGPADRLIERNSLYLVTGWMKAKAWGIATYNKRVPPPYNTVTLLRTNDPTMPRHFWDKSGGTMARTGPPPDEELDSRGIRFENQTLFIRGFKVSLSEAAWADLQAGEAPLTSTTSSLPASSPWGSNYFSQTSVSSLTTPSPGDNKSTSSSPPGNFLRHSETELPPEGLGDLPSLTLKPHKIQGSCRTCRHRGTKCDGPQEGEEAQVDSCQTCKRLGIRCLGWNPSRADILHDKQAIQVFRPAQVRPRTHELPSSTIRFQKSIVFGDSQVDEEEDLHGDRVIVEKSSTPKLEHPSDAINELILRTVPQARVSLVHDNDWSNIVENHGTEVLNDKSSLLNHVKAMYNVHQSEGLAVLRRNAIEPSGDFTGSQTICTHADQVPLSHSNGFYPGQPQNLSQYLSDLFPIPSTQSDLELNRANLHVNTNMGPETVDNDFPCSVPNIVVSSPAGDETLNQISVNDFFDTFPTFSDVDNSNFNVGIFHGDSTPDLSSSSTFSSTFSSPDYGETPSLDLFTPPSGPLVSSSAFSSSDYSETPYLNIYTPSSGPTPDLVSSSAFSSSDYSETPSLDLYTPSGPTPDRVSSFSSNYSETPSLDHCTFDAANYWPEDESPLFKDLEPRKHESKDQTSAELDYWDIPFPHLDNCS